MPELLTVKEAAEKLRCKPWTVRRRCRDGELPNASRAGGRWLIPPASIDNYLQARSNTAKPRPARRRRRF